MSTVYIYALIDPDTDEVRYVGKTENLRKRLTEHCNITKVKTAKDKWVASLIMQGKRPKMTVLKECTPDTWQESEKRLIAHYRSVSPLVVNTSDGGFGNKQSLYPSKLSIIAITDEMRQRIKDLQKVQKLLSEADIVRAALDQYLPGKKEGSE